MLTSTNCLNPRVLHSLVDFQQKTDTYKKRKKKKETHSQEAKQSAETDADMTQTKLSNKEFKITMVDLLKTLVGKMDNVRVDG